MAKTNYDNTHTPKPHNTVTAGGVREAELPVDSDREGPTTVHRHYLVPLSPVSCGTRRNILLTHQENWAPSTQERLRLFKGPAPCFSEPEELVEEADEELEEELSTCSSSTGRDCIGMTPLRKQTLDTTSISESGGMREPQTSKTL